jgi:uncharacterized repeat protein (TIGR01451 family)
MAGKNHMKLQRYALKRVWVAGMVFAILGSSAAWGANVLQTFFVPLPEDQMQITLNAIDVYRGNIGDEMQSAISMVVGTDETILYYDHWEDGFEEDITAPTQTTSQVWGDGDVDNGFPPGFPDDLLNAGDVVRLESTIDVTRNSVVIEYDGRDKVATTYPIAMTRAMYAVNPGEVLAEAMGAFDIGSHGTLYRAPVGVGTGTGFGTNSLFSYSSFYVMADYDFTRIDLDKDNDGAFEETVYLDEGEAYFVNGGIVAGATVKGSQPFQCHLVTGDVGSTYEMRWFELWPDSQWGTDYFTPVGSRTNLSGGLVPALVYLFNPNAETITVTYVTATNTGSFTVPPNSVYDRFEMPLNSGARFSTTNGAKFIGVNVFDTTVGGGILYGYPQHCQTYDWGIGLMPVNMMSTMGVVGWGPGQGTTGGGGTTNGNPIWISSISNTTIYVDYDSDPDTGSLVDPLGNLYDIATNVTALQLVQLVDTNDIDQTGMRYYTLDGAVLMGAWGQDSARAGPGNPFLDMGYAIPAFPTVLSKKFAALLNDMNGNGYADSGDTIEYMVDVINVGFATANNVIFQDDLPTNLTAYVTNSAMLAGGGATNAVPDSLPPKLTRFPFDEGGYNVGTVGLGATTTVRYVTQVLTNLPSDFDGYIHNNATVGGTNGNWSGGATLPVRISGLAIQKQASTTNLLNPGSNFTYTVIVANTGTVTYTGLNIDDVLPLGLSYVDGSAQVQLSGAITNTVSDRFNLRSFTNSNGTIPWLTAWAEIGEADGVAAGGVWVMADGTNGIPLEAYALRIGDTSRGATRQADLSGHSSATLSFNYRRSGLDGVTDAVGVYISSNNWASSNLLVNLQGAATDTNFLSTNFNVSAYISTNTGVRLLSTATLGAADYVWFDNVTFTLTGTNASFAGNPPPTLAQNLTLPPGGTATVTLVVQVVNPPVATQAVNQARVRADQQVPWVESNPVTNAINATEGITLQKTSSTTNLLVAGTSVVYTILISNTGTVAQTGIHLEDLLPYGMTYSNGTASLYRPFTHTNEFIDLFDRQAYTNSDGNVAWSGDWAEIGDDGNPTTGNLRLAVDGTSIPGQTYALRTVSTSVIQRAANLAGYTTATLWVDYRRVTLDAGDVVNINVSSNGGGTFTQVGQVGGATNDGSYRTQSFDISAYASTGTVVRFGGNISRDATDIVWLDNIRIAASAANATNALPPPPVLLDGYTLPPGTNMTVRLTATVDDPIVATTFLNTAQLLSDQQTTWITSRVTNAASGAIGMKLTKSSSLASNWDYGVTNDYYVTIENTGTVTLAGIRLTDALPAGVTFVPGSAAIVDLLWNTTNAFTETVSDGFGTVAYDNNDGSANWLGNWAEVGDNNTPASGNVLIRTAGGTNALVFENNAADNDFVTRTNSLANLPGRTYTNVTLSFAYRRQGWDANDSMTFFLSTNGFATQSNLIYTVPSVAITDAAYSNFSFNVTSSMGAQMALRVRAGPSFANGDRFNLDFVTFTNQGYDVVANLRAAYSNGVQVSVVSNLAANPTNLLVNATLAPGTSVTVRLRGTLDVPLVATQFVNTATTTNVQTAPATATVTNFSVANAVGDRTWFDADGDGIQDGGEVGLTGVVVRIYSGSSNLLLTTTSGVAGAYAFTNLPTGSYFLEFVTPTNFLATLQDQGSDALDSDISTNTGRTAAFTLAGGTNDTSRDAGYYQPSSSIGNFIWRDVDGDGIQDGGSETGMPGVVVTLYDSATNVVSVTTSSVAGAYAFTNLPTGNYFLEFTAPTNFTFTLQDQGGDDGVDSDVSPVNGRTALFYLPPGTVDNTRDAGLSAVVYGLRLTKTSSAGACLAASNTITYTMVIQNTGTVAQSGIVLYDELPAGLAYVPGSVTWVGGTLATAGPPPNLLVNLTLTNSQSATVTVQAVVSAPSTVTQLLNTASTYSSVQPAIFAAVTNCVQYADVGVQKFVTTNAPDQVQIIEYLLVATNRGPDTATGVVLTDVLPSEVQYNSHSNGTYNAGTGVWTLGTLSAYASTTLYINVTVREGTGGQQITNVATVTGHDLHDPIPSNDTSSVVIVPKGGATVGNWVWFDANGNGIQDSGETNGIANLPVALMTTNGVVVTSAVTSADGTYLFANVLPGTYAMRFNLTNVTTNVAATVGKSGGDDAVDSDVTNGVAGGYLWTGNFTLAGGQTNLNIDLGLAVLNSTRADVAEVWGEWAGGEGRVVWRTSSEWNTAGFFVYRIDPETGAEVLLNDLPVPSAFEAAGAVYELADPDGRDGGSAIYRLEELELTGDLMDLGTHAVVFGPEPAKAKTARAEVRATRDARRSAPLARQKAEGPSPTLKVLVAHEGIYGVALQAIADGMGRPLEEIQLLAETGGLSFSSQGSPVATIHDAVRGQILFHGQGVRNRYTREAAYLISEGEGLAMAKRAPEATDGATVFPAQVRFEEDRKVLDSPTVPIDDFFYWDYVIAGTGATSRLEFPLELTGAAGDVALKVRLMGWTRTNHLAEFRFNGEPVGSATFFGQETVEAELAIPAVAVSSGVNTLTVQGSLPPGNKSSAFVVDWIEAAFDRAVVPLAGAAHFRTDGRASVSAAGFTEPLALALNEFGTPVWIADESGELPAKAWAVAPEDKRFAVIEAAAVPLLEPEPAAADAWFLAETNRIDYLVVVSRELESAALELAEYRAGQGLRVGVAVFEDICDLMANGLRTPEAIPELLSYAEAVWAEAPWMVVLAGNGSYDYQGTLGSEVNHIPPMLVQTAEGLFAADELMADSGGDELPDVAIGRLPALTAADLTAMIAKIKAYEAGFGEAWQNQLVLASDKADLRAGNFTAANAEIAALAGADYPVEVIDLDAVAIASARAALMNRFKEGAGFIHYTGHGGAQNWSKSSLLTKGDVAAMSHTDRPSVTVALSCLVGRYEVPGLDSMGELLMRQSSGGAVAVWGPSGLSRNDPATALGEAFYRAVLQEGSGTLGLAILHAIRGLQGDLYSRDTLAVYNLLGDPALRIANNTGGHVADASFAQWRWQRFAPGALADPETSGAGESNFFAYAMGGGYDVRAELPEFGYPLTAEDEGEPGFILRWKRRIRHADVDYKLYLSSDLQSWEANSPDLQTVGVEADPDGIMETVRTKVNRPESMRVFMGIKAVRK